MAANESNPEPRGEYFELIGKAIDWAGAIVLVVIVGAFADPIARAIAGKSTHFAVTVGISVGISVVGVAALATALLRSRAMRSRNSYLRRRVKSLEDDNEDLRGQLRAVGAGPPQLLSTPPTEDNR